MRYRGLIEEKEGENPYNWKLFSKGAICDD